MDDRQRQEMSAGKNDGFPSASVVRDVLTHIRPRLEAEGWHVELIGIRERFVMVRLEDGPSGMLRPWVLRRLEAELTRRLPAVRGVFFT